MGDRKVVTDLLERGLSAPRYHLAISEADALSAPYSAPPIPVLEIAEQQGVDVVFADFDDAASRVAGFCDFEEAKLYVNASDGIARQTFTIAHELGHWILHKRFFDHKPAAYRFLPRFQRTEQGNPYEREANCFAANLLVPKRLLLPVRGAPVAKLAGIFSVSREMMEIRLKNV